MREMPLRRAVRIVCYSSMFALCGSLAACVESVPPDVVQAIESVDNDLAQLRAAELAPSAYNAFAYQWVTLRSRVEAEEDTVRWPWESNDLEAVLRGLHAEGTRTLALLTEQLRKELTLRPQSVPCALPQDRPASPSLSSSLTTITWRATRSLLSVSAIHKALAMADSQLPASR